MSTVDTLLDQALALSPEERADLARRLILSLGAQNGALSDDEWIAAWNPELEERLGAYEKRGGESDRLEGVSRARSRLAGRAEPRMIIRVLDEAEAEYIARRHIGTTHGSQGWDMTSSTRSSGHCRRLSGIRRDIRCWKRYRLCSRDSGDTCSSAFHYVVFTMLPNELLIVAVAHARRDPGYWAGRVQSS